MSALDRPPSLTELIRDPIILLMMKRDGVDPEQLLHQLRTMKPVVNHLHHQDRTRTGRRHTN